MFTIAIKNTGRSGGAQLFYWILQNKNWVIFLKFVGNLLHLHWWDGFRSQFVIPNGKIYHWQLDLTDEDSQLKRNNLKTFLQNICNGKVMSRTLPCLTSALRFCLIRYSALLWLNSPIMACCLSQIKGWRQLRVKFLFDFGYRFS